MLTSKAQRIIVIGHETSRSGAPILLLNLFTLLRENYGYQIKFAILRDGPLTAMYRKLFPVLILKKLGYGQERNLFHKLYNFFLNKMQLCKLFWYVINSDIVFSNTIVNGKVLRLLSIFNKPVITYVHELESVIELYLQLGDAKCTFKHTDIFAFPSNRVREILQNIYQIPQSRLLPLSYYFPFEKETSKPTFSSEREKWERFGISEFDFVVGAMGYASKRKGTDLFVEVFKNVYSKNESIKFCWIGDFENEDFKNELFERIPNDALGKNIIFTGGLENSFSNFIPFDLFFLSSREDPYPLVVLEAAWMCKPSICFSDSGGIPEFIENDAGWVVDHFNIQMVSEKILDLWNNQNEISIKGNNAREKVVRLHGNANLVKRQFDGLLQKVMDK